MKIKITHLIAVITLFSFSNSFSQEETKEEKSNIQTYTPSKLLSKGQWDIKWGNNLYTETKFADSDGNTISKKRANFFTSSVEVFRGVSDNSRFNIGFLAEFRSNTIGGRQALAVFSLEDTNSDRKGIGSIAPSVKFQPFKNIGNFSIQSALHIPLVDEEQDSNGVFLDQASWIFQNRFFYDYTFNGDKWQLFTELNTEYAFGKKGKSFANNTYLLVPSVFMSYFPTPKSTVLGFVQHSQRFGDFTQNYTALGFGGKYQITKMLNIEALYSNFVRGNDNGLGQSFNLGVRALF